MCGILFVCTYVSHSSHTLCIPIGFSVHLEAADTVLLERYSGKRVDSLTGGRLA